MHVRHILSLIFSCIYFFFSFICAETDYYKILEVDRNANIKELKKAYLRLSKKWHPDKNGGDEKKFRDLSHAYEVLSNPEKRKIYDMRGEEGLKAHEEYGDAQYHDAFDIFSKFFQGGFHEEKKGPDIRKDIELELEVLYYGGIHIIDIDKEVLCNYCKGSGRDPKHKNSLARCSQCNGKGTQLIRQMIAPGMFQTFQVICNSCSGQGHVISHPCTLCNGKKVLRKNEKYTLNIPPGAPYGYQFVFENEANESPNWVAGDLYIVIVEKPYSKSGWRRKNSDLYRTETISLSNALLGDWSRRIKLFNNEYFNITKPAGHIVQSGHVDVFPQKGMPVWNSLEKSSHLSRGNVYIEWRVILPELKLNDPLRKKLAKILKN
ncbi:hypothetical protein PNEG_02395 [Pneumocystis murina B123]|uniref:Chaperone DnaJ n=1 Tax=Pneumocystis murina (strain B123) TaxID=1069680 RepID=M7NQA4_PNEMU|nr:hypothetical protein PNEG_02395 [Pneumocystis murina B123]EMR09452.1 hypothetical protein PNEG_02395 [Pneumocystis murina B123]